MSIRPQIIFDFAHKTTKPLGVLEHSLDMFEKYAEGEGLRSEETRKRYVQIARAITRAIMDLRHLAMCEAKDNVGAYQPFNWKLLIHKNLPGSSSWGGLSESLTWEGKDEDYNGSGYVVLLERAVSNVGWFNKRFWSEHAKVKLSLLEKEGRPWIECVWSFGNSVTVDPKFASFDPFFSMDPNDNSLPNTAGLALYAAKLTVELHGGNLIADMSDGLAIRLSCPKDLSAPKAGAQSAT